MRELLFKNMSSWNHNKRDVSVEEAVEKDGVRAKTTRRCLYFVKEKIRVKNPMDLKNIAEIKTANDGKISRHFHILKVRDSDLGVDKLMCKVAGTFYAMVNDYLYCVVFIHTFKIAFLEMDKK